MARVAVAPHKYAPGLKGDGKPVPSVYKVDEVETALLREYPTDAHLVTYVVEGACFQPRISKQGLARFPGTLTSDVFFADVDKRATAAGRGCRCSRCSVRASPGPSAHPGCQ